MSSVVQTIYLPRTGDEAPEPAPYLLTEAEVIRILRLEKCPHPSNTIRYYRDRGMLKAVQVGKNVRFTLPDVLEFIENSKRENPR